MVTFPKRQRQWNNDARVSKNCGQSKHQRAGAGRRFAGHHQHQPLVDQIAALKAGRQAQEVILVSSPGGGTYCSLFEVLEA